MEEPKYDSSDSKAANEGVVAIAGIPEVPSPKGFNTRPGNCGWVSVHTGIPHFKYRWKACRRELLFNSVRESSKSIPGAKNYDPDKIQNRSNNTFKFFDADFSEG